MLRNRGYLLEYRGTFVDVKELPAPLLKAVKAVGYKKRNIEVIPLASVNVSSAGGAGQRAFAMAVNLQTGKQSELLKGSWGGPSPYSSSPMDDLRAAPYKIPNNGAVIKGSEGGGSTWAQIYIHPDNMAALLPGDVDLTDREKTILAVLGLVSSYRKQELARGRVTKEELRKLRDEGYIKVNKAGAIQLTTKGKNAKGRKDYF